MSRYRTGLFAVLAAFAAHQRGAGAGPRYVLEAAPRTVEPGQTVHFKLKGEPAIGDFKLETDPGSGLKCKGLECTTPSPGKGLVTTGDVKVSAVAADKTVLASTIVHLVPHSGLQRGPWEGRAIIGYHQAGAASASYSQNVILDFYLVRPLMRKHAWDSRVSSWGNVRIASAPRQLNSPFVNLLQSLLDPRSPDSPLNTKVNELALSGEFQSGIEINLAPGRPERVLGLIGFVGASGAFDAPDQHVRIFETPQTSSPQSSLFRQRFPNVASKYVGFANPDRDRFYRQWGLGLRYSRFRPDAPLAAPHTFSATLGQDESITGGRFQSVVTRWDAFYPLPLTRNSAGRWQCIYLFGTASLRVSRGDEKAPLVLKPAPVEGADAVRAFDPAVTIVTTQSNRDTYRIGIGVDLVNLIRSVRVE